MKDKLLVICVILLLGSEYMVVLPRSIGYPSLLISVYHIFAAMVFLLYFIKVKDRIKYATSFFCIFLCFLFLVLMVIRREAFMIFDIAIPGTIGAVLFVSIWLFYSLGNFIHIKTRTSFLIFAVILIVSIFEISVYMFMSEANIWSIFLVNYIILFPTSPYSISLISLALTGLTVALILSVEKRAGSGDGSVIISKKHKNHRTVP